VRFGWITGALSFVVLLVATPATAGQSISQPVAPWDGQNPFRCQLQSVGTGTDFPDPSADPFCVEFDKTNQNLTDFGLADFLLQEPARTAAAVTKCFYYQRDHWTGSIVQGHSPELWHWDGNYFFDRARGVGGVSVRNFRIGGVKMDATPFVPAAYRPYFDPNGGGGVVITLETDPDPICGALVDTPEEAARVYASYPAIEPCVEPGGPIRGRRVGRARLGMRREALLRRLGPPGLAAHEIDSWCLIGKGELRVAYRHHRAAAILTSGPGQALDGVARGDRAWRVERRLDDALRERVGGTLILIVRGGAAPTRLVGIRGRRVRWVGILRRRPAVSLRNLVANVR
jgi:hypothetical protein